MKNGIFHNTSEDLAKYLIQRNNKFHFTYNFEHTEKTRENKVYDVTVISDDNQKDSAILDLIKLNPVSYVLNIFPQNNMVNILIDKRTYLLQMEKVSNKYQYFVEVTIPQVKLDLELNFSLLSSYVDGGFSDASDMIDEIIKETIYDDLNNLQNPTNKIYLTNRNKSTKVLIDGTLDLSNYIYIESNDSFM